MFGVVQSGVGGTGIAAPFANPSPPEPRERSSARYNKAKQHTALGPFRDDTRLVALRYDQTVALEPPIPLPPPRSPLRPAPRSSSFNLVAGLSPSPASHSPVVAAPPPRPPPPAEQHPALRTITTPRHLESDKRRDSVHTFTTTGRPYAHAFYEGDSSDEDDETDPFAYERIDAVSGLRPRQLGTVSAGSSVYSLHAFERSLNLDDKQGHFIPREVEVYEDSDSPREGSLEEIIEGVREEEGRDSERVSEAGSRPSEASLSLSASPALSVSSSASPVFPASPATPPPHFSKRFVRSLSLRSGSFSKTPSSPPSSSSSSSPPPSTPMKRLRKKSLAYDEGGKGARGKSSGTSTPGEKATVTVHDNDNNGYGNGYGNGSRRVERAMDGNMGSTVTTRGMISSSSNNAPPLSPTGSHSSGAANPIRPPRRPSHSSQNSSQNQNHPHPGRNTAGLPSSHPGRPTHAHSNSASSTTTNASVPGSGGPVSPIISTSIPCGSFFEDDDLNKLSFSIRGSLIFGGKRLWKTSGSTSSASLKMAEKDVIPEQAPVNTIAASIITATTTTSSKGRAFPLVPASRKDHQHAGPAPVRPPRDDDMGVAALIQRPFQLPESPRLPQVAETEADIIPGDNASVSHKLPPSIRVISAEVEKESQKVRSLYESGEGLQLGDGDEAWPLGPAPEPPPEAPSDAVGNDAPSVPKHGLLIPTSASTSSPALPDKQLAGGIEDWEGVEGDHVDRYGFIVPPKFDSSSPPGTAISLGSSPVRFSSRKHRNVLVRNNVASHSLGARRGPTKKLSARSLNTHTSEISALSRRSVRSTIRQATNLLPHNKDRRLVDQAGDLLALQPGLSFINEDDGEKVTAELKRKEVKRSEKWRKMAKVVKPGLEGHGTVFHFDVKNAKLIERTWKGIPDCWRSAAWYSFLATSAKADQVNYVSDEDLTAAFRRLVDAPSPDDMQIDLDVPRTINQHIMFRRRYRGGQRLLFRVLHAMSLHFPDTGYVQGMATLAATLLSYYDEEQCFIMLVRLWQFRGLNRIYQSGFVELIGALKDFETHWLNDKEVAGVLRELCIDPTAYATRWYLTLFNLSIPFPVQLRVWDVFMLLGSSPPEAPESGTGAGKEVEAEPSSKGLEILHATSLAIIDTLNATLIDSDFENAMKSLTSWVPIKDEQRFLEIVHIEWKKHQTKQKKKS
ncbi:rab-GTPase-TBC domain-containing protein [Nemania sp. FL0916]|nr:rab-GTPase-TBC domain-containing protein [Nemania sp. FL0916]